MRAPELESLLFLRPADPSPCLVYADWLTERGALVEALGYQLLAGVAEQDDALVHALALHAVASAVFALDATPLEDDDSYDDDDWETGSFDPYVGARRAVEYCGDRLAGLPGGAPILPRGPAVLINEAATELIGSVFNGRGGWNRAACLARQAAPPAPFLRAWNLGLASLAANPCPSSSTDQSLASTISALSDDDLEPLPHLVTSLDFPLWEGEAVDAHVLTWHPASTAGRAFTSTVLHRAGVSFSDEDASTRREILSEELFLFRNVTWRGLGSFEAHWRLMSMATRAGDSVLLGNRRTNFFSALEPLGPLTRAALAEGSRAVTFFEFVRGWLLINEFD